jgi:ATP-dependent DNA ligase
MTKAKNDDIRRTDNAIMAFIAQGEHRKDWRKLSLHERREALEKIAGVADDKLIGAVIIEVERERNGQKNLF